MFRLMLIIAAALALSPEVVRSEQPPLLISIGVPADPQGKRELMWGEHLRKDYWFPVVVTNLSDKPVRIWEQGCSWGNQSIFFEATEKDGALTTARLQIKPPTETVPDFYEIAPKDSSVYRIYYNDTNQWKGFPAPGPGVTKKVTMQAVLRIEPDDSEAKKLGIWTGEVRSTPREYRFIGVGPNRDGDTKESTTPTTGLPVLTVRISGPARAVVGDTILFTIVVKNRGPVAATNVRVLDNYDPALKPTRASDGWQLAGNDIYWDLPQLPPGYSYERQVECLCQSPAAQACNRVLVTAQEAVRADAEACLEVSGTGRSAETVIPKNGGDR
jgi:uncharacterized repeat protein (TIGR01451 family)